MSSPQEPPPSYAIATGSSAASAKANASSHLEVPGSQSGIPVSARRSIEDEIRPLPTGWIRQFDPKENHQFFVDTKANPPRSIWHHPLDDDEVLKSLSAEERERLQEEEDRILDSRPGPSSAGGLEDDHHHPELPPRPNGKGKKDKKSFGEKFKDKMTGMTHEERVQERARRAEQERQYYEAHMKFRQAMQQAQITGQPQFLAKDKDGKDVYVEPPGAPGAGFGDYGGRGYGVNPYSSGPYADPNARFIRPAYPYQRPGYGYGYGPGYGYGSGLGLPIAGGLLGGLLLGGLLF